MDGREFHRAVLAHEGLEWLGVRGDDVYVRASRSGGPVTRTPVTGILAEPWESLEPVLTGARRARTLTHQTRIVGYYASVRNWNKSKVAELADRRRAPRTLSDGAWAPDGIPDAVVEALVAGGAEAVCDARRPS